MNSLLEHIQKKTGSFSKRPFFIYLVDNAVPVKERLRFAPCMAHFVFSFMDINRFVLPEITDNSECQRLINVHAAEDAWHWPWYLQDLIAMGLDPSIPFSSALRFLWGGATHHSRFLTYQCIALLGRATVLQKIAIVETIEMTGKAFLDHTARLCALWPDAPAELLYFGQNHADCETGHHMGTDDVASYLESIKLDPQELQDCIDMVDIMFGLYENFVDEMLAFSKKTCGLEVPDIFCLGALKDTFPP